MRSKGGPKEGDPTGEGRQTDRREGGHERSESGPTDLQPRREKRGGSGGKSEISTAILGKHEFKVPSLGT